jgi:hypothetical protein
MGGACTFHGFFFATKYVTSSAIVLGACILR